MRQSCHLLYLSVIPASITTSIDKGHLSKSNYSCLLLQYSKRLSKNCFVEGVAAVFCLFFEPAPLGRGWGVNIFRKFHYFVHLLFTRTHQTLVLHFTFPHPPTAIPSMLSSIRCFLSPEKCSLSPSSLVPSSLVCMASNNIGSIIDVSMEQIIVADQSFCVPHETWFCHLQDAGTEMWANDFAKFAKNDHSMKAHHIAIGGYFHQNLYTCWLSRVRFD